MQQRDLQDCQKAGNLKILISNFWICSGWGKLQNALHTFCWTFVSSFCKRVWHQYLVKQILLLLLLLLLLLKYISLSISLLSLSIHSLQLLHSNILTCKGSVTAMAWMFCKAGRSYQAVLQLATPAGIYRWLSYTWRIECGKVSFKVLPQEKEK